MKERRPFSSSSSQINIKKNKSKKKLRILSACLSASELIPNNIKSLKHSNYYTNYYNNSLSKRISSRPQTTSLSMNSKVSKMNLFGKSQSELDCLNLMIDSNPSQYNSKYIEKKNEAN